MSTNTYDSVEVTLYNNIGGKLICFIDGMPGFLCLEKIHFKAVGFVSLGGWSILFGENLLVRRSTKIVLSSSNTTS